MTQDDYEAYFKDRAPPPAPLWLKVGASLTVAAVVASILCLVLMASGCAMSPTKRLALAEDTLASTLNGLVLAESKGYITHDTLVKTKPAADAATAALFAAEKANAAGDKTAYGQMLASFNAAMDALQTYYAQPAKVK